MDHQSAPTLFVPGYEAIQRIAAVLLEERVGSKARLLIVGAGGGSELAVLASAQPAWTFVAVDPSESMLDFARRKAESEGFSSRVRWVNASMEESPCEDFDGATCLHTLHYLPDNGCRQRGLARVRAALRKGAPLALAHLAIDAKASDANDRLRRYTRYAILAGAEPAYAQQVRAGVEAAASGVSADREEQLLTEAGFCKTSVFFKALDWRGWITYAG